MLCFATKNRTVFWMAMSANHKDVPCTKGLSNHKSILFLTFERYALLSITRCWRERSGAQAPASPFLRIGMICSSLFCVRIILQLPLAQINGESFIQHDLLSEVCARGLHWYQNLREIPVRQTGPSQDKLDLIS